MLIELMHGIDIKSFIGDMFYILLGFVFFDVVTGLVRAGKDRKLTSSVYFDGLIRKAGILLGVVFLTFIDIYLGTDGLSKNPVCSGRTFFRRTAGSWKM